MELNGWLEVFGGGMLGPVAVELAKIAQMPKTKIPKLYSRPSYWILTLLLALLGGLSAVAHGTARMSLGTAMQLGATAPLFFAALASGRRQPAAALMPGVEKPRGWELLRW